MPDFTDRKVYLALTSGKMDGFADGCKTTGTDPALTHIHTVKEQYRFDNSINSKILCFAFGLVAEIERNLISLRTKEALALRKAEGKILGRQKGYTPKMSLLIGKKNEIIKLRERGVKTSEICEKFGICRDTYY
jgi:DNA invertase Pin-like site-specific DNA recombinase